MPVRLLSSIKGYKNEAGINKQYLITDTKTNIYTRVWSRLAEPQMSKPDFCICENKGADQLRGSREADQRFCFRYTDSTIPLERCSVNTSSIRPYECFSFLINLGVPPFHGP